MRTLANISIWEMTEPLKWTAFKRLDLLFMSTGAFFRYDKPKVRKIVDRDLKIAKAENEEADLFIKEFANKTEEDYRKNLPF